MPTIVLYGNSLALSAIGASLAECADVGIVRISARPADGAEWLAVLDPAAVIFDRIATRPDFAIPLVERYPQVLFVGLDPSSDRLVVLSGRESQPESAADLVQLLIQKRGQATELAQRR